LISRTAASVVGRLTIAVRASGETTTEIQSFAEMPRSRADPEQPDGLDPVAFVERQTRAAAPTDRTVARVDAPAQEVGRPTGEPATEIEALGDDRCRAIGAEDTLPWLAFRLLVLDADFEVHDPPELRPSSADLANGSDGEAPYSTVKLVRMPIA
jgi:hypothetical protein